MRFHERGESFGAETGTDRILDINNLCEHQILTSPLAQMTMEGGGMNLPMHFHERGGLFGPDIGTDKIPDINNLCVHQFSTSLPAQMAMEGGGNEYANGCS